jgi:hypothetical protein
MRYLAWGTDEKQAEFEKRFGKVGSAGEAFNLQEKSIPMNPGGLADIPPTRNKQPTPSGCGRGEKGKKMVHDRYFRRARPTMLALALLLVSLWGCSSTAPSRFFELSPVTGPVSTVADRNGSLTVGITKIGIPDYLNRPQIATFHGSWWQI